MAVTRGSDVPREGEKEGEEAGTADPIEREEELCQGKGEEEEEGRRRRERERERNTFPEEEDSPTDAEARLAQPSIERGEEARKAEGRRQWGVWPRTQQAHKNLHRPDTALQTRPDTQT